MLSSKNILFSPYEVLACDGAYEWVVLLQECLWTIFWLSFALRTCTCLCAYHMICSRQRTGFTTTGILLFHSPLLRQFYTCCSWVSQQVYNQFCSRNWRKLLQFCQDVLWPSKTQSSISCICRGDIYSSVSGDGLCYIGFVCNCGKFSFPLIDGEKMALFYPFTVFKSFVGLI